jgi:DNA primase
MDADIVSKIKNKIDIHDVVAETVMLKQSGRSYTGMCPFHANTNTPAFVVWPDEGRWRCFGACNEGGDVIDFVMRRDGVYFGEAVEYLAEKAGIPYKETTEAERQYRAHLEVLKRIMGETTLFYQDCLSKNNEAQQFLLGRGINRYMWDRFGLGYAPNEVNALVKHLLDRGYDRGTILESGAGADMGGNLVDRFRLRIIFPVKDAHGKEVGLGGRTLKKFIDKSTRKFLNTPQTPIFDKSSLLYGLSDNTSAIRAANEVLIVEGYMDAIALTQEGYSNVVATMGTAFGDRHLALLRHYTNKIVMLLDGDKAAELAAMRSVEVIRQEKYFKSALWVVRMPDGKDPDEMALQDRPGLDNLLANKQTVVNFVLETVSEGKDLTDPKVKNEIARAVVPLINEVGEPVERDVYWQNLARMLGVKEKALFDMVPKGTTPGLPLDASRDKTNAAPVRVLGILANYPFYLHNLNRNLREVGLAPVTPSDFTDIRERAIMSLIDESLEQYDIEFMDFVLAGLPAILKEDEIAMMLAYKEPEPFIAIPWLFFYVLGMRMNGINDEISRLTDNPEIFSGLMKTRARLSELMNAVKEGGSLS